MLVQINPNQVAGLIVQRIFEDYQSGMGANPNLPAIIDPREKQDLEAAICDIIKSENESDPQ